MSIQWAKLTLAPGAKIKFKIKLKVTPCAPDVFQLESSPVFGMATSSACVVEAPPLTVFVKASRRKHKKRPVTCSPTPAPTLTPTARPITAPVLPYKECAEDCVCLEDLLPGEVPGTRRRLVGRESARPREEPERGRRAEESAWKPRTRMLPPLPPCEFTDTTNASRIYNVTREECAIYW